MSYYALRLKNAEAIMAKASELADLVSGMILADPVIPYDQADELRSCITQHLAIYDLPDLVSREES